VLAGDISPLRGAVVELVLLSVSGSNCSFLAQTPEAAELTSYSEAPGEIAPGFAARPPLRYGPPSLALRRPNRLRRLVELGLSSVGSSN